MKPLQTIGLHKFSIESAFLHTSIIDENVRFITITAITDKEEYIYFTYTKFKNKNFKQYKQLLQLLRVLKLSYKKFKDGFVEIEIVSPKGEIVKRNACIPMEGLQFKGITSYEVYSDDKGIPKVRQYLLKDVIMPLEDNLSLKAYKSVYTAIARSRSYIDFHSRDNEHCKKFLNQLLGIKTFNKAYTPKANPFY